MLRMSAMLLLTQENKTVINIFKQGIIFPLLYRKTDYAQSTETKTGNDIWFKYASPVLDIVSYVF